MPKHPHFSLFARGRRHSDAGLAERLSATENAVIVLRGSEIKSASHGVRDLFGYEPALCPGRTLSELFGVDAYARLDELQTAAEAAGGHLATARGVQLPGDAGPLWVDITIADLRHDPKVAGTVVTIVDCTDRVEIEKRIREIEHHDPLTQTANAAMFDVLLERAMADGQPVGLVVVGTAGLAEANNVHGSNFGDAVLIEVARRLASVLRTGDHVSRVSNAKFAMIVNHLDPADPSADLAEVTDRLSIVLDTPFAIGGSSARVQTTLRAAHCGPGESSDSFIDRVLNQTPSPVGAPS
jgi:PAS domain S-box-containing protein